MSKEKAHLGAGLAEGERQEKSHGYKERAERWRDKRREAQGA